MPGKINPTQIEAMTMVTAQVMGNHVTITIAGSQGQLEINAYKPVIIYNILQSIRLLGNGLQSLTEHCLEGLQPNLSTLEKNVENSLMLATALNPYIGYSKTAEIVKRAMSSGETLKQSTIALGFLTAEQFDQLVVPQKMV